MEKDTYEEATELLADFFCDRNGMLVIPHKVPLNTIRLERKKRGVRKRDLKIAKIHWMLDTVEIKGGWYWVQNG